MTSASTKRTTIRAIMIKLGMEMEMNPQLKNFAGPLRDIACKTIVSPFVSGFADHNEDTLHYSKPDGKHL
jgi:hypothetical protein